MRMRSVRRTRRPTPPALGLAVLGLLIPLCAGCGSHAGSNGGPEVLPKKFPPSGVARPGANPPAASSATH